MEDPRLHSAVYEMTFSSMYGGISHNIQTTHGVTLQRTFAPSQYLHIPI